jgi:anti-sigma factor RsiW
MNPNPPPDHPDDARLSAWLDGELDADGRAQVDAWLRDHPEDAAQARLWAADRDALRARFDPVLDEPVPESLRQTVLQAGRPAVAPRAGWRQVAVAAGLLVTGAVVGGCPGPTPSACAPAAGRTAPPWPMRSTPPRCATRWR